MREVGLVPMQGSMLALRREGGREMDWGYFAEEEM